MPCRETGQGHVVTDTFSLSTAHLGSPCKIHTAPSNPCSVPRGHKLLSQQREPRLTHAKSLPSASTEIREHILAQKERITSQKKERCHNSSMVTACLGHYRTSVHSCTCTGYFYLNHHYLNLGENPTQTG